MIPTSLEIPEYTVLHHSFNHGDCPISCTCLGRPKVHRSLRGSSSPRLEAPRIRSLKGSSTKVDECAGRQRLYINGSGRPCTAFWTHVDGAHYVAMVNYPECVRVVRRRWCVGARDLDRPIQPLSRWAVKRTARDAQNRTS